MTDNDIKEKIDRVAYMKDFQLTNTDKESVFKQAKWTLAQYPVDKPKVLTVFDIQVLIAQHYTNLKAK